VEEPEEEAVQSENDPGPLEQEFVLDGVENPYCSRQKIMNEYF